MRTILPKGGWLAVVLAATIAAGCVGPQYTNPKKTTREDVAVDVLDCQKAAVLRHKAVRLKHADASTPEARQAANTAARGAWERCLKARGWNKNT